MEEKNLEDEVLRVIGEHCDGGDRPELDCELSSLNLDSLSFIAVLVDLETIFGIEFGDEELNFYDYKSAADLAKTVRRLKE